MRLLHAIHIYDISRSKEILRATGGTGELTTARALVVQSTRSTSERAVVDGRSAHEVRRALEGGVKVKDGRQHSGGKLTRTGSRRKFSVVTAKASSSSVADRSPLDNWLLTSHVALDGSCAGPCSVRLPTTRTSTPPPARTPSSSSSSSFDRFAAKLRVKRSLGVVKPRDRRRRQLGKQGEEGARSSM
jgi:hypothetical protein